MKGDFDALLKVATDIKRILNKNNNIIPPFVIQVTESDVYIKISEPLSTDKIEEIDEYFGQKVGFLSIFDSNYVCIRYPIK